MSRGLGTEPEKVCPLEFIFRVRDTDNKKIR